MNFCMRQAHAIISNFSSSTRPDHLFLVELDMKSSTVDLRLLVYRVFALDENIKERICPISRVNRGQQI